MNYGALFFLAGFLALSSSWLGMVLAPQLQVGREGFSTNLVTDALYPARRPGLAEQGAQVYRANGCVTCHSQQVRQTGSVFDVVLIEVGTNPPAVLAAVKAINSGFNEATLAALPKDLVHGVDKPAAEAASQILKTTGAKYELRLRPIGPDIDLGWGHRGNVGQDYLQDSPALLGSQRIGPDLANIGTRKPDPNWQLNHLYDPAGTVPGSFMPPYRFLFEKRAVVRGHTSADAIKIVSETPSNGSKTEFEIVPTENARALVAYLQSLQSDAPLFAAPLSVAAAPANTATNAPAK